MQSARNSCKKPASAGKDAAFALDRFDKDGSDLAVDHLIETGDIIEPRVFEAIEHGAEATLNLLLRGRGHAAEGAAVEGVFRRNDGVALPLLAG